MSDTNQTLPFLVWTSEDVKPLLISIRDGFISPIVKEDFEAMIKQQHGIDLKEK